MCHIESIYNIFQKIEKTHPIDEFSSFSSLSKAYAEKSNTFTQDLTPTLEKCLVHEGFQAKVMYIYTRNYKHEKNQIENELIIKGGSPAAKNIYAAKLEMVNKKLGVNSFQELLISIEKEITEFPGYVEIYVNLYNNFHNNDGNNYIRNNFKYFYVADLLYQDYKKDINKQEILCFKYSSVVKQEYQNIGIDIENTDTQFKKYNLLSLNSYFEIANYKDSQTVYDSRVRKHFYIKVPRKLLFAIKTLLSSNNIASVCFRVDYVSKYIPVMEEMEFGSPLKLNLESLPELSRFYSADNFNDNLWVNHNKFERTLTFEEHLDDFQVIDDSIVTQVVHLEYKRENNLYVISHIDHEYILYTMEQYNNRLNDSTVKGYKKVKTFKIDHSNIPFNYKFNNEYFLYIVLDSYLNNTELIEEYFNTI